MATIKSYTDLKQSKKLAEILPIESADMFIIFAGDREIIRINDNIKDYNSWDTTPVWSLAALLDVLPNGIVMNKDSQNGRYHFSSTHAGTYVTADNPVDACYELILKLHELNLL